MTLSKRSLLSALGSALGMLGSRPLWAALDPTPRQTEGPFYPDKLPHAKELQFASRALTSIEINGTFYRSQTPATFASATSTSSGNPSQRDGETTR